MGSEYTLHCPACGMKMLVKSMTCSDGKVEIFFLCPFCAFTVKYLRHRAEPAPVLDAAKLPATATLLNELDRKYDYIQDLKGEEEGE